MSLKTQDPRELVSWVNETMRGDAGARRHARAASYSPNGTSLLGSQLRVHSTLTHGPDAPTGHARWGQEIVHAALAQNERRQWLTRGLRSTHRVTSRRNGFTLVEMLVVLTVFAFLLASAALALGTLFRAQSELQDELAQANTASRLAAQLRTDAHLATSAEVVREGEIVNLRLLLPNASINYAAHPRRIIRTVTEGETQAHREVYSLLEGTKTRWELSSETPAFITLAISYRSPELREAVARSREQRVETSIGLHAGDVK